MTPKQANESLLAIIKSHVQMVQSGKFGAPTGEDLSFCGKLHILIEEGVEEKEELEEDAEEQEDWCTCSDGGTFNGDYMDPHCTRCKGKKE